MATGPATILVAEKGSHVTKREAMHAGWEAGNQKSVTAWGVFGFVIPIVGVPVACLRSPPVPAVLAVAHDDDETFPYFETAFVERLKHRQVSAALLGGLLGFGLTVVLMIVGLVAV